MTQTMTEKNHIDKKIKIFLFVLLFIPCLLINFTLNNDIWFLLNSGRYVFANGIPHIEPFTIHTGMTFVMQQWMAAAVFWLVYGSFGAAGLFGLVFIVFACIIFTAYQLCILVSDHNFIVSYAVTLAISILISFFMVTRPYIFTTLIILLELYLLEHFIKTGRRGHLTLLPVLSCLQVNLQAAMWPVLFVVLIPYVIDSFHFKLFSICGQGYSKKILSVCILAMLLAGFINPYGLESMTYLFRSYGVEEISRMVTEMQPANINDLLGKLIFAAIFACILLYCFYMKGKTGARYTLLAMGTAYMALSSVRSFLFFAVCGLFPLAYYLKDAELPKGKIQTEKNIKRLRGILIALLCIAIAAAFFGKYRDIVQTKDAPNEAGAVTYVLKNEAGKKLILYTGYNEGGYAEFMGLKAYVDPRAEVFLKENNNKYDIMKEYCQLQKGQIYYKDVLNKYGFTNLLVSKSDILYAYLPHDTDYKQVYEDENYRVYEKS